MSKALEIVKNKLDDLKDSLEHFTMAEKDEARAYFIQCDINDVEQVEKELQVLEIIKEKLISMDLLRLSINLNNGDDKRDFYNSHFISSKNQLTCQEFELLEEVLCNDEVNKRPVWW